MRVSELMQKLQKIQAERGDMHVMLQVDETNVFELMEVRWKIAERDDYPENWGMDAGFEFVQLSN